jgi:hypothetical protein
MQQIILISGQQGSGKTSLQKALVSALTSTNNHKAVALNFADPLYEMHFAVLDIARTYGIKTKFPKDGPLLQMLGTDWGRVTMGENIWIDCLKGKMELLKVREGMFAYDHAFFVVGDCRFKNEFDSFPDALRVRLNCPEGVRKIRCGVSWRENTSHPSETDLNDYAERLKFNITADTVKHSTDEIVALIVEFLKSDKWRGPAA